MPISRGAAVRAWVLVVATAVAAPAHAEIEGITVQARAREENLQEVPISISALSAEQIQQRGLTSDYDIANFTVGFRTLQQTGRDIDRPIIRGMSAPASRGNANASYFLDGTFVAGSISTATTSAVQRVEVLRGPQSAQFGRATFSGAVNYVTRRPTADYEGQVNLKSGSHGDYNVGGWFGGPVIGEQLLFLASANWSSYGGQWRNELAPNPAGRVNDFGGAYFTSVAGNPVPIGAFRDAPQQGDDSRLGAESTLDFLGKLTWRIAEGSEVNFKYAYTEGNDSHFPSFIAPELNCYLPPADGRPVDGVPGSGTTGGAYCGDFSIAGKHNRVNIPDLKQGIALAGPSPGQTQADVTALPADPGAQRRTHRFMLDFDQDIGRLKLTARGAANKDNFVQGFDLDHTEVRGLYGLFTFENRRASRDYSGEVRLASPGELPVRGQLGVYYYHSTVQGQVRSFPGPSVFLGSTFTCNGVPYVASAAPPRPTVRDTDNKAVFGEVDWDLSPEWKATFEGRYGRDDLDLAGGNCETGSQSQSKFTPRITLSWQPDPDLNLYFQFARGNKPGDFNTEFYRADIQASATADAKAQGLDVVKEEDQTTYEVGAKTTWLDRRVTANLAAYTIDWRNQSLFTVITIDNGGTPFTTTILRNAGRSRIYGLEFESNFAVTDNLSLIANYGYTHARFESGTDSFTADTTGDGDLAGHRIPSVPTHNIILGGVVTRPLQGGRSVFLRGDLAINSDRTTDASGLGRLGTTKLANVRAGLQGDHWTTTLYVSNLLNDQTPVAALQFLDLSPSGVISAANRDSAHYYRNLWGLNPQRGRDYGLEIQYRF